MNIEEIIRKTAPYFDTLLLEVRDTYQKRMLNREDAERYSAELHPYDTEQYSRELLVAELMKTIEYVAKRGFFRQYTYPTVDGDASIYYFNDDTIIFLDNGGLEELLEKEDAEAKEEQNEENTNNAPKNINSVLEKAISHLNDNNFADYFDVMDSVVPESAKTTYQNLKSKFITDNYPNLFDQQLKVFTKGIGENLKE